MLLQTYIQQSRAKEENLQKLLTRLCAYRWIFLYSQRFRFSCVCWKVNERGKERLHHIYKHGVTTSHHTTPYRTAPHRTAPHRIQQAAEPKQKQKAEYVRTTYLSRKVKREREAKKKSKKNDTTTTKFLKHIYYFVLPEPGLARPTAPPSSS